MENVVFRKKNLLAFYVDVVTRDIPSFSLLLKAKEARPSVLWPLFKSGKWGCPTFIRHITHRPSFVITTSYNMNRSEEVAWRSRMSRSIFIEFTSEQYFSSIFEKEKLPKFDNEAYYRQDFFFAWSEAYAQKLVCIAGVPRERIYIVSSPKVDLSKLKRRNLGGPVKRVLFVSDYGPADWDEKKLRQIKQAYGADISASDINTIRSERDSAVQCAIDLSRIDGLEIVFRLHPGENLDNYFQLKQSDVIISLGESGFLDDVVNSDLVVGYTTTSVFEVLGCGIPFISLHEHEYASAVWRDYLPYLENHNKNSLLNIFRSGREAVFKNSLRNVKHDLEYFSLGIGSDLVIAPSAFWSAVKHIQTQSKVNLFTEYPPIPDSIKFCCLGIAAGFLRACCTLPGLKKLISPLLGTSQHNITHPMHNFSKTDIKNLSFQQDVQLIKVDWKLTKYGFKANFEK
jgi:hypothetical protein